MKNKILPLGLAASVLVLTAVNSLQGQSPLDTEFDAVVSAINAQHYRPASVHAFTIAREIKQKWNSDLSNARKSEALHAPADREATLNLLDQARSSYKRGDWETALFDLTVAMKGIAVMQAQLTPAQLMDADAAEAEQHPTPTYLHQAASTAFDMGDFNRAIQYSNREIKSIPGYYHAGYSAVAHQRAYTLLGMSQLALNDMKSATDSLMESLRFPADGDLRNVIPNMTLARQLLLKNQTQTVLTFLTQCEKLSSNPKVAEWKSTLASGQTPDFGIAGLVK